MVRFRRPGGRVRSRREFLRVAIGGLGAAAAWRLGVAQAAAGPGAARRPNLFLILADDLGYADVGFQGCKDIPTPHLDSLAGSAVRCTSGYVSHPFCSPTRAGLMTGRYQQRFGHENNPRWLPDDPAVGLPLGEVTLPQALKPAGYVTGCVGKWHLGAHDSLHPCARGFDEYFGLRGGGHDYFQHNLFKTEPKRAAAEYFIPLHRNRDPVEENEYLTDALGREAEAFIRRHKGQPWMLYLAFNAPHTPLQVPPKYLERVAGIQDQKRRTYGAMICAMDDAIGRALAALRETGAEEDTLIFFLSDNGGPTGVTNSSNEPLRGAKGAVYEGGIRVPFLVRWPARLKGGRTYERPVCSIDVLPTFLSAGGAPVPANVKLDGVDLLPHLAGGKDSPPHERLFWRTGGGRMGAVREGRWKLVKAANQPPELYDLEADVAEKSDLAAQQAQRVAAMVTAYEAWSAELVAPKWESPVPGKAAKAKKAGV